MDERAEKMRARMESSRGKVMAGMWYMAFTDTMLDLLPTKGSFTHEELKAELERRLEKNRDSDLLTAAYEECLERLEEHRPK
ncbi:hypothetical protein [Afifella pfennigii]|uniref:hypothetical protein n=1 Tax=Afifella pfennigii TaxID=209897 RepID=UPI00047DCB9F|nr:hypothetical protein [Afifella pfennigii]